MVKVNTKLFSYIHTGGLLLWLFFMIVFSGDFANLKMLLLFLVVTTSAISFLYTNQKHSMEVIATLCIWLVLVIVSYSWGIFNDFDFSFYLLFYYFITPIFCFIIAFSVDRSLLLKIDQLLLFSTLFIILLSFYYIGFRFGYYSFPPGLIEMQAFGGTKITDAFLEVRLSSQSSLMFLLPYCLMRYISGYRSKVLLFILLSGLIVSLVSGRRALQIIIILSFIYTLLMYVIYNKVSLNSIIRICIVTLISIFALFIILSFIAYFTELKNPFDTILNTILMSFDSSDGAGNKRHLQAVYLFDFFAEAPLFGHGLNSHPHYIRNSDEPWSYEWVYLAFLAQNGILFTVFTCVILIMIFRKYYVLSMSYFKIDSALFSIFLSINSGYLFFIIAGSTNPMIYFSWFWFLSLIGFNTCYKNEKF